MAEIDSKKLKGELKEWESSFRVKNNGSNPTKDDIKLNPAIAEKYKLYAKSKAAPAPAKLPPPSSSSKVASKNNNDNPFLDSSSSSSIHPPIPKAKPSKPVKPSIVANSPNKLRDLVGQHSLQRSPNKSSRHLEVDDIFGLGAGGKPRIIPAPVFVRASSTASFAAKIVKKPVKEDDDDDDEVLGPSPVKPSASSSQTSSQLSFKPLFGDIVPSAPAPTTKTNGGGGGEIKKVFQADFTATKSALVMGLKEKAKEKVEEDKKKRRVDWGKVDAGDGVRDEEEDEDEDEDNFGSEEDKKKGKGGTKTTTQAKGKGKAKAKATTTKPKSKSSTTKKRAPKKPKFSHPDPSDIRTAEERGTFVLDVESGTESDEDEADEDKSDVEMKEKKCEKVKPQVVVRPRRAYGRSKNRVDGGDWDEDEEDSLQSATASLFYTDNADLLASYVHPPRPHSSSDNESDYEQTPPPPDTTTSGISLLPEELQQLLSLNSSPIKKTNLLREKSRDLRVKKLLHEPSTLKRGEESEEDGEGEEEGGDDDWASEAEGWKDLGDGEMDGWGEDEKW